MKSGVLKSGSPKLKLIISFPCAFNSLARAAIARVCEVDRLLILSDNELLFIVVLVVYLKSVCYANCGFRPRSLKCVKCE